MEPEKTQRVRKTDVFVSLGSFCGLLFFMKSFLSCARKFTQFMAYHGINDFKSHKTLSIVYHNLFT